MIVQKPQFDTNVIRKGQAYWIKSNNRYESLNYPCIVRDVEAFKVVVTFYGLRKENWQDLVVTIDDIVNSAIKLTPMVKEEN